MGTDFFLYFHEEKRNRHRHWVVSETVKVRYIPPQKKKKKIIIVVCNSFVISHPWAYWTYIIFFFFFDSICILFYFFFIDCCFLFLFCFTACNLCMCVNVMWTHLSSWLPITELWILNWCFLCFWAFAGCRQRNKFILWLFYDFYGAYIMWSEFISNKIYYYFFFFGCWYFRSLSICMWFLGFCFWHMIMSLLVVLIFSIYWTFHFMFIEWQFIALCHLEMTEIKI